MSDFVAIGNDELREALASGDEIACPKGCGERHAVVGGKDEAGNPTDVILAYRCGGKWYLCGVAGRRVTFKGDAA